MSRKARVLPVLMAVCSLLTSCGQSRHELDEALVEGSFWRARFILTLHPKLLDTRDEDRRTPLHKMALGGYTEAAELLLEKGADANSADRYGYTPLHYAAQRGHFEVAALLIENGADLEVKNHYDRSPLHLAAERGHKDVVELLTDRQAQVFTKDKNGRTPAELAYDSGHTEISEILMPLHHAAKKGDLQQIESLLETGPKTINSRDRMGRTPLHRAMRYDQDEAARLLIERGADRGIKDELGHPPEYYSEEMRAKRTGIDSLEISVEEEVDRATYRMLSKYSHVNLGLVHGGEILFTKSFGEGSLSADKVWGSVSKPVTATIIMHLLSRGEIESIDDPIWKYSPRYRDCMPARFADVPLTIRHLLTHKSGIPHNNEPTWKDGKLNLKFRPGCFAQ